MKTEPGCWERGGGTVLDFLVVIAEVCGRRCRLIGAAGRPYVRAIHFHFTARASTIGGRADVIWVYLQVLLRTLS